MRALVTGGAGFIGSALARALLERGDDVRILDNLLTGREDVIPEGADVVRGDLRDLDEVRAAMPGVDVVFHQAALRSVPKSVDQPILAMECNVRGTLNTLVAAADAGVRRLVYASSSSVYGEAGRPVQREDDPPDPRSPYAVSKLAGEQYCRVWTHLGRLSTVSLRYFNVFGPGQHPDSQYSAVFPAFVSALVTGTPPEVHWDGDQTRDFTYIDDVVRANIAAADAGEAADGAVLNIAGGRPKSINDVLRAVSDAVGTWVEPRKLPKRSGDVRATHADLTAAHATLRWEPRSEWSDAVAETVAWFRRTLS